MRKPQRPPEAHGLLAHADIRDLLDFPKEMIDRLNAKYIHWDKLRRYPAQELQGWSPERVWLALKRARTSLATPLPLEDTSGRRFWITTTPTMLRYLHTIDQSLGGMWVSESPGLISAQRDRYLINSLMEEAIASSQLEGAATTRQKAKAMLRRDRQPANKAEQMILNNYRTITWVLERVEEDLTPSAILEIHESMTQGTLKPQEVGRFRLASDDVFIADQASGDVMHVPPAAASLPESMEALCEFANARSSGDGDHTFLHPVLRAIAIHFWLAYVHPFVDGNGRTARALFYWNMLRAGYWVFEFLPISRIILKSPGQYARAFLESENDDADMTYFAMYNLRAIALARDDLQVYLQAKQEEARQARRILKESESFNHRQQTILLEALQNSSKSWTVTEYARRFDVTAETARRDLYALRDKGLMRLFKIGRAFAFESTPGVAALAKEPVRGSPHR